MNNVFLIFRKNDGCLVDTFVEGYQGDFSSYFDTFFNFKDFYYLLVEVENVQKLVAGDITNAYVLERKDGIYE